MDGYLRPLSPIPAGRKRGDADIAIDFETQIFGFPNHALRRFDVVYYIYESPVYDLVSFAPPIGEINKETGKVDVKGVFFRTGEIVVRMAGKDWEEECLDDYSYSFITQSTAKDDIFRSKDFLTQVCITHTIHRLRTHRETIEPFNDHTRRQFEKLQKLESAFLGLLKPVVAKIARRLFLKWNRVIDYAEIESMALAIAGYMVVGENKNTIGQIIDQYSQGNLSSKRALRSLGKGMKIHPFSTNKDLKNTDIKKSYHLNVKFVSDLILEMSAAENPIAGTLALLLIQRDDRYSFITGGLNRSSERVYFPNSRYSIINFILGRKKFNLTSHLSDFFKNERHRIKRQLPFNDDDTNESFPVSPKKWKKNDVLAQYSNVERDRFKLRAPDVLKGKLLEAYINFLSGIHNSTNQAARQNLSRARKIIKDKAPDLPH